MIPTGVCEALHIWFCPPDCNIHLHSYFPATVHYSGLLLQYAKSHYSGYSFLRPKKRVSVPLRPEDARNFQHVHQREHLSANPCMNRSVTPQMLKLDWLADVEVY